MIDERVVGLAFKNSQFLSGIKSSLDGLSSLKNAMRLDGAKQGISDIERAYGRFSLGNMGTQIQGVNGKFLALATVAVTALSRITSAAMTAGTQLVKSLTVDPINQGLQEYETNLNSIQTILANTQSKGSTLSDVNGALQELNEYADLTIYNFAEMARNIGTFTAAGVGLETATTSIKGIANLAAVSGSSSQQASTAMYQLSQALSTGTVKLMDWNSVVNAGMGGELFQENLKETARVHGVAVDQIIDEQGSFRDSLQTGWLTSEILTESLMKLTGDLTDSQLESMGYTKEQIVEIQKMAKTASDAATKVKTFSQLVGTLQEAAGSGWAQTWQLIFGDFEEAKELFTGVNDVLSAMIGSSADMRNKVLGDWKELGGRTAIIKSISNAFYFLMDVIKPIKEAFRQIFPPVTGKQLADLSKSIQAFTERLTVSKSTALTLKRIFGGIFAAFSIGVSVIKGVASVFGRLFAELFKGSGEVGLFLARIGDMIVKLDQSIKMGEGFTGFFTRVGDVLVLAVQKIKEFSGFIGDIFKGVDVDSAASSFDNLRARLEPLGVIGRAISGAFEKMWPAIKGAYSALLPFTDAISEFFSSVGERIVEAVKNVDYDKALDTVNTGLFAALVLIARRFVGFKIEGAGDSGFVSSLKEMIGGVTETFGAMQTQLKAGTLQKIAVAIALITASVVALSFIDSAALTKALAAITVMFVQMSVMLAVVDKMTMSAGFLKLPAIGAALIGLATAVLVLSAAVKILSTMSWEELGKGLGGVAASLAILTASTQLINTKGLARSGPAMIGLAVAVLILSKAVQSFGSMSLEEIGKGLGAMAASLAIIAGAMAIMQGSVLGAAALVIISGALVILGLALKQLGGMSWDEIGKALTVLAASLLILAVGVTAMTGALVGAAALVVISAALVVLGLALSQMGGMSWDEIGKALTVLASSLLILAVAVTAMTFALAGAAALVIISAALLMLAPALAILGQMSWGEIGRGLFVLAAALAILGLAGALMTPVIPTLLGLGAAILLIGAGLALAGAGVLAFSIGLTALAGAGVGAAIAIGAILGVLIGAIPALLRAVGEGLVALAEVIAGAGPQLLAALATIINSLIEALRSAIPNFISLMTELMMGLLDAINTLAPEIINTLVDLILNLVDAIIVLIPAFVTAGIQIMTGVLNGIAKNIGQMVTAATNVIVAFLNGISKNIPRIIQAAINLMLAFINGLADGIRRNQARMEAAMRNLADALISAFVGAIGNTASIGTDIVSGIASGIRNGVSTVTSAARDMARAAWDAAKNFLDIRSPSRKFAILGVRSDEGLAKGLVSSIGLVTKAGVQVGKAALTSLSDTLADVKKTSLLDGISGEPTIRPVLDLSDIQSGKKALDGLLKTTSQVSVGDLRSYTLALDISSMAERRAEAAETASASDTTSGGTVNYVQNINSPKPVDAVEVYRQTRNQLASTKERLRPNAYSV